MSKVAAAFTPIIGFLLVLNALGGIVSGIWLAVLGQWWALGVGLLGVLVSHFLIGILIMPSLLLAVPAATLTDRGRQGLATILAGISSLYTSALAAAWGSGVLYFFLSRATTHSVIPLLVWSYGVATGPWSFLASKDQEGGGNEYSAMATFFFQVGYALAMLLILVSGSFPIAIWGLVAAMGVNWLLQMVSLREQVRAETLKRRMAE